MVCLETLIASLLTLTPPEIRHRVPALVSATLLLLSPALLAAQQSPQPASPVTATFQFATIKPSDPQAQGHRFRVTGHRLETTNTSLLDLISFAYGLHTTQIISAPDWVQSDRFNLTLQAYAEGLMDEALWTRLLQRYLMESFKLSFHRDTKDLPLYVLAIAPSGLRLATSKRDPRQLPELSITLGTKSAANANLAAISASNATMADLASVMQRVVLEWPVVDQTGLTGHYDFALTWTPDGAQFGEARARIPAPIDVRNPPPYLATALQQQTGLTIELVEAPLQVLVIDSVGRSAENLARREPFQDSTLPGRIWRPSRQPAWLTFSRGINPFLVMHDLY
jgi:bla regulator protein blaR1